MFVIDALAITIIGIIPAIAIAMVLTYFDLI